MVRFVSVCVEYNKNREVKDGLHQYRNMSQSQAPNSLEKVIFHLVESAEKKLAEKKGQADQLSMLEADQGELFLLCYCDPVIVTP